MSQDAAQPFQSHDWNGDNGDRWVANQVRLDRMLEPFGQALLKTSAVAPGERVLDVGCGAGTTTVQFGRAVGPAGRVLGVDISEALIRRARERVSGRAEPVWFEIADAADYDTDTPFDLLVSRFGVMFFDAPEAAFAQMRRSLRPGGRLVFVCWRGAQENDWVRLPMGAVRDILPPYVTPSPEAPGPFAFGERARVERILSAAGYSDIMITPFDHEIVFGAGETGAAAVEDALGNAWEVGPLSRALGGADEDVKVRAATAVRQAFANRLRVDEVVIDGAAWIVTARNPADAI